MISTVEAVPAIKAVNSERALAGIRASKPSSAASMSWAVSMESRNPSAAAKVALSPSTSILTPVRTGRASSLAAAKTVRSKALRRMPESTLTRCLGETSGNGGKSSFGCAAQAGIDGCRTVAALGCGLDVGAVRFVGDLDLDASGVEAADGVEQGSCGQGYGAGFFDLVR